MDNEELIAQIGKMQSISEEVANALRKIKREYFIPEEFRDKAYFDAPLPIGKNQTISAPSMVAYMLEKAELKKGMDVLDIGAGSGWLAGLIAEIMGKNGRLTTVEMHYDLMEKAKFNLYRFGLKNIEYVVGDGSCGYKKNAPYDRIIVSACMPSIPDEMKSQLKKNGKIIAPVGSLFYQMLVIYDKKTNKEESVMPVLFVLMAGKCGFK